MIVFCFKETGKGKFCSQTWPGECPFSEVETRNIRDYVLNLKPTPILALSLHSAVEAILFPYSFNASYHPENINELVMILFFKTPSVNLIALPGTVQVAIN